MHIANVLFLAAFQYVLRYKLIFPKLPTYIEMYTQLLSANHIPDSNGGAFKMKRSCFPFSDESFPDWS